MYQQVAKVPSNTSGSTSLANPVNQLPTYVICNEVVLVQKPNELYSKLLVQLGIRKTSA